MRMRLQGKRALVTGAGPNIGQAICLALAEEGATVACNSMDSTQAHAVTEQIQRNGGRALAVTDQALAVLYLVSEDAEFVTGCDLRVDGGSIAAWGDRGPSQRPES